MASISPLLKNTRTHNLVPPNVTYANTNNAVFRNQTRSLKSESRRPADNQEKDNYTNDAWLCRRQKPRGSWNWLYAIYLHILLVKNIAILSVCVRSTLSIHFHKIRIFWSCFWAHWRVHRQESWSWGRWRIVPQRPTRAIDRGCRRRGRTGDTRSSDSLTRLVWVLNHTVWRTIHQDKFLIICIKYLCVFMIKVVILFWEIFHVKNYCFWWIFPCLELNK